MYKARIARFDSVLAENFDNCVVMQAYPVSSPPFTVATSKYEDQEGLEVGYLQVIVNTCLEIPIQPDPRRVISECRPFVTKQLRHNYPSR